MTGVQTCALPICFPVTICRVKLGEIASLINDYTFGLDFIGKCVSCKVCARVMTEGGV